MGWSEFQMLHDFEQNGYVNSSENGNYPWYADLMRDTLKNGKRGFRPFSYYVQHTSIPADMFNGFYVDYDGVQRYYINGIPLPKGVDLVLPSGLVSVEDAAFLHIGKQVVFLPRSIKYIAEDAFGPEVTVMGYAGSAAETWANEHGNAFIRIN